MYVELSLGGYYKSIIRRAAFGRDEKPFPYRLIRPVTRAMQIKHFLVCFRTEQRPGAGAQQCTAGMRAPAAARANEGIT